MRTTLTQNKQLLGIKFFDYYRFRWLH